MEPLALPDDPILAAYAAAFNEAGHWAFIVDTSYTVLFATEELRRLLGSQVILSIGTNYFSSEFLDYRSGQTSAYARTLDDVRRTFSVAASAMLWANPEGRDGVKRLVDPRFHDILDQSEAREPPPIDSLQTEGASAGMAIGGSGLILRIDDGAGRWIGSVLLAKPAPGMTQLGMAAGLADLDYLERIATVGSAERRPAAVLMADLEASSPLARRLSTEQFFAFGRRLVRAIDACTIDQGGIVGRHAGDGVVAFFLSEMTGSESAAARACIEASRAMRTSLESVLSRSDISDPDITLRFGLHWGGTLFIGQITTRGRSEVTALGDEVNATARIEACATGGRTLASKDLIERLSRDDATAVGIDRSKSTYIPLGELPTATEKARRDAPAIAVSEV
jgi:class 3 adenylate cyclase